MAAGLGIEGPHRWPLACPVAGSSLLLRRQISLPAFRPRWARSPCGRGTMRVKIPIDVGAQLEGNGDAPEMSWAHVYRSAEVLDQLKSSITSYPQAAGATVPRLSHGKVVRLQTCTY